MAITDTTNFCPLVVAEGIMEKLAKRLNSLLIELADELDVKGSIEIAAEVDDIIKKLAAGYPAWGETENRSKQYALFEKYRNKEISKEQYQAELKKLQEQAKAQSDPMLEQKTYQKLKQENT